LCSDGLGDCLEDTESLRPYLRQAVDTIPAALLAVVERVGGTDDTTALVVSVESESQQLTTQRIRPPRGRRLARFLTRAIHAA
jgi:serine/threonine protein phosphatase PrpC